MILHFALDPALSFGLHHISYCPKRNEKKEIMGTLRWERRRNTSREMRKQPESQTQ
jgi:hypothetical protein